MAATQTVLQETIFLVIALLCSVSRAEVRHNNESTKECDFVFRVEKGDSIDLHLHNFTKFKNHTNFCSLHVTSKKNLRIVLDLVYVPPRSSWNTPNVDCTRDYVHVGNDPHRVDVHLMTSFKFCGEEVRHELVSEANHMWLVYRATQLPQHFFVNVQAKKPVLCLRSEFTCSPIQCVDRSRTCDGVKDCTNGRDEYCAIANGTSQSEVSSEPCFRCGDGTCILPRLSRNDVSYGHVLWYLCDGFAHCPDAWDEKPDTCLHKEMTALRALLIECVPSDALVGVNESVLMWYTARCDDVVDCEDGQDEFVCGDNNDSDWIKLRADPGIIGAVTGVLFLGLLVFCVGYNLKISNEQASRPSTTSTEDTRVTQCTSMDSDTEQCLPSEQGHGETFVLDTGMSDRPWSSMEHEKDLVERSQSLRQSFV